MTTNWNQGRIPAINSCGRIPAKPAQMRNLSRNQHIAMAMSHSPHIELIEQLSRSSRPYRDPLARIDWDRLDRDSYWLPESGIDTWINSLFVARLSRDTRTPATTPH